MSEYTSAGGALALKKPSSKKNKKNKKSEKKRRKEEEEERERDEELEESVSRKRPAKTPAEIAFEEAKRRKQEKDLNKKAAKTHKERILEFNQKLDDLSEHYDIPKVSWTK